MILLLPISPDSTLTRSTGQRCGADRTASLAHVHGTDHADLSTRTRLPWKTALF
jgi:hypothetical protein